MTANGLMVRLCLVTGGLFLLTVIFQHGRSTVGNNGGVNYNSVIQRNAPALESLPSDSPLLLQHLRQQVLVPPSNEPYRLHFGVGNDPSDGQSKIIDKILGGTRDGFYVECGGYTGEVLSNTLFFELERGWHGVLIEPDEGNYKKMLSRNRKAYTARSCLGESNVTQNAGFKAKLFAGHIVTDDNVFTDILGQPVERIDSFHCFPLYSFLLALNTTTVDYFSLDVEGTEYKVLESIPWEKVNIKTLSVEYNIIPEGRKALVQLLTSKGYVHYMEFNRPYTHDYIFVKKGILKDVDNLNLPLLDEDLNLKLEKPADLLT